MAPVATDKPAAATDTAAVPVEGGAGDAAKPATKEGEGAAAAEEVPMVSYGELFQYADGIDKALMIVGSIAAFINGAGMPAFSEVFGELINKLAQKGTNVEDEVSKVAAIMVYVGLVVFLLSAIQVMTWMIASERQIARIRRQYFDALLHQDAAFYDENKPGSLSARLVGDTRVVKAGINDKVANGIMNLGMFLFGFGFGFYRSWQLTLVMLSTMPIISGVGILMTVVLTSMTKQSREGFAEAGDVSEEVLQSVRTVQSFGAEDRELARFETKLAKAGAAGVKKEFSQSLSIGLSYGVIFSSYSLAFWFSGWLIRNGHNNVGEITAVFFSVLMGSFGIGLVFPPIGALAEARGAAYKIFQVLNRKPAIDSRIPGDVLPNFKGEIQFVNVAFSYPTRKDTKLFTNLNLTVESGTTVAFSGASGTGKSSTIALVQRLYDPDQGSVLVDGVDLKTLDLKWWRDQVGVVSQEPNLFSGSIRENVLVGKPDATDEEIIEACKQASVHETISNLPDGYNTVVGNVGSMLSGGQKQRIAIARAIIKRPKLLILDEATSALDRKSEAEVQAALDKIMQGAHGVKHTVLVIAHRLTTIRNADVIHFIVNDPLTGSEVAESGTFDKLIELGGHFAHMVSKQIKSTATAAVDDEEEEEAGAVEGSPAGVPGAVAVAVNDPYATGQSGGGSQPATPGTAMTGKAGTSFAKKMTLEEIAKSEEEAKDVPLVRIIKLSAEKSWAVIIGLIGSVISGGIYPAYAVVLAKMLNVLGTSTNDQIEKDTPFWAGMFVVIGVSVFIGWALQGFYGIAGEAVTHRLRCMLFRNILRQDQTFFDTPGRDPGSLGQALDGDTEAVHLLWGPTLGFKVQMACNLIVGLIIAFVYSWKIALVTMSAIPVMIITGAVQQILLVGFGDTASANSNEGAGVVAESLSNVRTVAAFNYDAHQSELYAEQTFEEEAKGRTLGIIVGIIFGFSQFTFYGVFALAFWYGGTLMQKGEADFTDVLIASMAVLMGAMGAGEAGGFAAKAKDAGTSAKKVFALIDHVPGIDVYQEGVKDFGPGATIDFTDVKFVYPARPKAVVLRHFNNRFENAHQIGLMGTTGCGKSTIIQLLGRFYDPIHGSISVNGTDLKAIDLKTWRSELSVVLQEPSLFAGSVMDNIKYGVADATDEEVYEVAKLAAIHDEILAMENGYNTDVGYKGRKLSGGQKQRVAIARGLLRKPRLLLLDEATSALDNATEATVMNGLREHITRHPMTLVSVAHRLTTIQHSNKIVLMDGGVVLEQGSHEELIALDGHYADRFHQYMASIS